MVRVRWDVTATITLLSDLNFHLSEVVSCYRDPQLQLMYNCLNRNQIVLKIDI